MTGAVRLVPYGGGEIVGDSLDRRVEILSDTDELHATWSRFGPGRDGADLHVHHRHTDLFYVLDAELTVRLGMEDKAVIVPAATLAHVPPFVVHGFRNAGDFDVRYLNFHAPGEQFADYMRALREGRAISYDQHPPPADGGRPPAEAVIASNGFACDRPHERVVLLTDSEEIAVAEVSIDPGRSSAPRHLHRFHVESFYVLSGEMIFTAGGRDLRAEAGAWVQIPAGEPHTFAVPAGNPVRFLNLHTPSCGFGAFLHGRVDSFDQVPV